MAQDTYVQASLWPPTESDDPSREPAPAARPDGSRRATRGRAIAPEIRLDRPPARHLGPARRALRLNHVRVTRDPDVALAWDRSSRLSAEITWHLARTIDDGRLAELRARAGPAQQGERPDRASAVPAGPNA